jgi:hypothetical protein
MSSRIEAAEAILGTLRAARGHIAFLASQHLSVRQQLALEVQATVGASEERVRLDLPISRHLGLPGGLRDRPSLFPVVIERAVPVEVPASADAPVSAAPVSAAPATTVPVSTVPAVAAVEEPAQASPPPIASAQVPASAPPWTPPEEAPVSPLSAAPVDAAEEVDDADTEGTAEEGEASPPAEPTATVELPVAELPSSEPAAVDEPATVAMIEPTSMPAVSLVIGLERTPPPVEAPEPPAPAPSYVTFPPDEETLQPPPRARRDTLFPPRSPVEAPLEDPHLVRAKEEPPRRTPAPPPASPPPAPPARLADEELDFPVPEDDADHEATAVMRSPFDSLTRGSPFRSPTSGFGRSGFGGAPPIGPSARPPVRPPPPTSTVAPPPRLATPAAPPAPARPQPPAPTLSTPPLAPPRAVAPPTPAPPSPRGAAPVARAHAAEDEPTLSQPRSVSPQVGLAEPREGSAAIQILGVGRARALMPTLALEGGDEEGVEQSSAAVAAVESAGFSVSFEEPVEDDISNVHVPQLTDDGDSRPTAPTAAADPSILIERTRRADVGLTEAEVRAFINRARDAEQKGDLTEAVVRYSDLLSTKAGVYDAHIGRGRCLMELGDYGAAMSDFHRADDIAPASSEPIVEMGNLFFARKDYRRAIEYYDAAIERNPNDAMAWCKRGISHHYRKNSKQAFQDLQRAQTLNAEIPNLRQYIKMVRKAMEGK